jgi:hypothetical protein
MPETRMRGNKMVHFLKISLLMLVLGITLPSYQCAAEAPAPKFFLQEVRSASLQRIEVKDNHRTDDVFLYAPDQKTRIVSDGEEFCGAAVGDTRSDGHYYLIAARGEEILFTLSLGEIFFVKEHPWNGMNPFSPGRSGSLLEIIKYVNCRGQQSSSLFFVTNGKIRRTMFIKRDGSQSDSAIDLDVLQDGRHLESVEGSYSGNGGDGHIYYHIFSFSKDTADHDLHEVASWSEPE